MIGGMVDKKGNRFLEHEEGKGKIVKMLDRESRKRKKKNKLSVGDCKI